MKKQILTVPNLITMLRIIGSVCLCFTSPLNKAFFVVYTLSGLSDVLDGFIARTTNSTSKLGAKLDSVADMLFYLVMLLKIFPILWDILPPFIWICVGIVLFIRLASYIIASVKFKCFSSMHTYMNKLTGFAVFVVPYVISSGVAVPYCFIVCTIGAVASAEELIMHIKKKDYDSSQKTIVKRESI